MPSNYVPQFPNLYIGYDIIFEKLQQPSFSNQFNIFNFPGFVFHHKRHQRMVSVPSIMSMAKMADGSAHCPNGNSDKSIILGICYKD